jgi:hypothetical protein
MLPSITQATNLMSNGRWTAVKGTHADHAYILGVADVILLTEVIKVIPCFRKKCMLQIFRPLCKANALGMPDCPLLLQQKNDEL